MIETIAFLKWPLVACLVLPWLLVYLGIHVIERQVIFVDLAQAQVAALGTCASLLLGFDVHEWQSFVCSLAFSLGGAVILSLTRTRNPRVPQEALIGIVYVMAAAAGILMLNFSPHGKEELQRSLVGELLVIQPAEIFQTFLVFVVAGSIHFAFRSRFQAITESPDKAAETGISVRWWDFVFYVVFAVVVMSFSHIGGVLLVFTYLIVPAVCAGFLAVSLKARFLIGWLIATLGSVGSLCVTAKVDLPIGAAIVCGMGVMLILSLLISTVWKIKIRQ